MKAESEIMPTPTTTTLNSAPFESMWLYVLLALLGTAGFFYVNLAAAMVDGLTGALGFSSAQAGTVMSANIYGASVGGIIAVFVVRRFSWRRMLTALLCVLLVLELFSLLVHSYYALLPLRALDGLVGGLSVGVALSLMARTRFPDRAFGALLVFQFAFGGLGSWWLPAMVKNHGIWVLFTCMAAMDAAAIITAILLRMPDVTRIGQRITTASVSTAQNVTLTVLTLLALFPFQAANMSLFAFIIPLGQSYALTLPFVSQTVGWTTWIGTLGALFVIVYGTKFGRTLPLVVAMIGTLIGIAGFYWSDHKSVFFGANAITSITWSIVVPYLFGIVSMLDRTGRLATLAGFVSGLGLASGPLLAGWVVGSQDYVRLVSMALALMLVASVVMLVAARRVDRLSVTPTEMEV